jgi:DNA-binding winged helix-turn-helix (wHTH) protein/TolB-like protein
LSAEESPRLIELAREAPFRIGALEVRPSTREVVQDERREVLEPRIMKVLTALARRRGAVVSRDELLAACWGVQAVSDDAIQRAVAGVRKVGEAYGAFAVETVAKVGYRLSVARADAAVATPRGSRWRLGAAALAVLATCALGVLLWRGLAPSRPAASNRIAVLPFAVLSPGTDVQTFGDGLLDELLSVLNADEVQALSRTDSLALRGPGADQALRRLDVGLFLDGAVRKEGGVLKVHAFLNDAKDHTTLWSHDFEGPADAPDLLQARIAARASDAANTALVGQEKGGSKLDSAALAAFVASYDYMANTNDIERPKTLLRQVIAHAPGFARAHSNLALLMPDVQAARAEARRALALDPKDSVAIVALQATTPMWAWADREALLLRGVAADPDAMVIRMYIAGFDQQVGRNRDALEAARRSVALNPVFETSNAILCEQLTYQRAAYDAANACQREDRLWPDYIGDVAQFYADQQAGREQHALVRLTHSTLQAVFTGEATPLWARFLHARIAGDATGSRAAALAAADAAEAGKFSRRDAYFMLALVGDVDAALSEAERYFTDQRMRQPSGAIWLNFSVYDSSILFWPATASVRRDPRFMALVARLKLVDYWRTTGAWPDFCSEPGLPYDCKTEAAKLAARNRAS